VRVIRTLHIGRVLQSQHGSDVALAGIFPMCGGSSTPLQKIFFLKSIAEMERNLYICVTEKTKKVSRVRSKYPEWWLALVDEIGYGLDEFDREQLRQLVQLDHSWDKIILVNPLDHRRAFEL
jgi:hypothetical protein